MTEITKYTNSRFSYLIYFLSCLICVFWLNKMYNLNELPVDTGDGLMHYYISQASWTNPSLFLDHWGKPLFILLSSPFAQLGFSGMFVFNLLIFIGICLVSLKIFMKFEVNLILAALFPITLLLAEDFSKTIMAGLTEPLFNLFVLLAFWMLIEKKWLYFALIISLTPYLRSEGQLLFLLAIVFLVLYKQFKYLPFLLIFPIIYGIWGIFVYNDFWWYITKSAYSYSNNIYGHGKWNDYFVNYQEYLGDVGLYFFILASLVAIYLLIRKNWIKLKFSYLFFSFGIFLGIVLFHSYLWANGKYGSLGLTRIATQGMPLFVLMSIYYSDLIFKKFPFRMTSSILLILTIICFYSRFNSDKFPIYAEPFNKDVISAGNYLNKYKNKIGCIHYHHPLIPYQMNYNPFINTDKIDFYYGSNIEKDFDAKIKKGDVIVWDSKFGAVEAGMPFDKILHLKQLSKVNVFENFNEKNKTVGAYIFKYDGGVNNFVKNKTIFKLKPISHKLDEKIEFRDVYEHKKTPKKLTLELELDVIGEAEVFLVCTDDKAKHYQAKKTELGKNTLYFTFLPNQNYKIYLWNQFKKVSEIKIESFKIIETIYPGL